MVPLPDGIEKLLPTNVIEKAYDDVASLPAREVGKIAVDVVKTARLLLAPFQLAAAFQDRFERAVERIRVRVPEERQREAPAEIAGPSLQQMQYLEESNPLWQMFEELLTRSVDSEAILTVHPSFAQIISQLSRDEAVILSRLRHNDFKVVDKLDFNRKENRFENRVVERSEIPEADLWQPAQVGLYYSHLDSLSLVQWPVQKQEPIVGADGVQSGIRRHSTMQLTEFGRLFAASCIPDLGFRS
ncbi:MAG: Abi-alpha family protein [Pseudomonadota bacterium]